MINEWSFMLEDGIALLIPVIIILRIMEEIWKKNDKKKFIVD